LFLRIWLLKDSHIVFFVFHKRNYIEMKGLSKINKHVCVYFSVTSTCLHWTTSRWYIGSKRRTLCSGLLSITFRW